MWSSSILAFGKKPLVHKVPHLSLVPLHLLEDGEVEVDLLHPGILLLESKREEEFSRVSRPELTELELLLNFP